MMLRPDGTLHAEIVVREYGEEPRHEIIGPFVPEEGADTPEMAMDWLEDNLRRQGDDVVRVWYTAPADVHDYAAQVAAVLPQD